MTLSFSIRTGRPVKGMLKYLVSEHSFLFEVGDRAALLGRIGQEGVTSLVLDTLQLEVSIATGELLFAWGFSPLQAWDLASLVLPSYEDGSVLVDEKRVLKVGVSEPLPEGLWKFEYDATSGWMNARSGDDSSTRFIRIAHGVVLGVHDKALKSIWLHPVFSA